MTIAKVVATRENADNTPNSNQFSYIIKEIVAQRSMENANLWISLSNTLNTLGPCVKNNCEWKNVWLHYKRNVQKFVDRNGTKSFNHLQRLTYE